MKTLVVSAILCTLLSPGRESSVRAEENTHKAALELIHLILPSDTYARMIDQNATQMVAAFEQRGIKLPQTDVVERLKKVVMECMPYEEMLSWTAEVYAARFTVPEIGDMVKFYKTPTGGKLARLLPELMGEAGKKTGTAMAERMPAAMKKWGLVPGDSEPPKAAPTPAPTPKPASK